MDDFESSLVCQENQTCLEGEVVDEDLYSASEHEYVDILIDREMTLGFKRDESPVLDNWVKSARLDAINWILKTRATFGFRFQTAYLSVTYLDRFLSRRSIDSEKYWAFRLLSVACLSLAAKMEECNVPALSEFPLEDYNLENKVIQRMELLVLSTLEWRMRFITPFAFLPYFITRFCNESPPTPSHIWSNTKQLILTVMKEVNLMDYRPSVIAAAASLAAMDRQLTRKAIELKMRSVSQYRIPETENIFACYNLILRLYMEKTKTDKLVHSSSPSTIRPKANNVLESSLVSSTATTKRRRLTFNNHKESHGGTHYGN